jgi:hypothetical protein
MSRTLCPSRLLGRGILVLERFLPNHWVETAAADRASHPKRYGARSRVSGFCGRQGGKRWNDQSIRGVVTSCAEVSRT